MSSTWNRADTTLLIATVIFMIAVYCRLNFAGEIWAEGLLAVSEAALVGGVADWFAVTAVFEKPLGFPYHTAILPKRRDTFINSMVTMVRDEFFSTHNIFRFINSYDPMPYIINWLKKDNIKYIINYNLNEYIKDYIIKHDNRLLVDYIADRIKNVFLAIDTDIVAKNIAKYLAKSGRDKVLLSEASLTIRDIIINDDVRVAIYEQLSKFQREQVGNSGLAGFINSLLTATNVINLEEAAELIQKRLVVILNEVATANSPLQSQLLGLVHEKINNIEHDEQLLELADNLKQRLLSEIDVNEYVGEAFTVLKKQLTGNTSVVDNDELFTSMPELKFAIEQIISQSYNQMLMILEKDDRILQIARGFVNDILKRTGLHARIIVERIVRTALGRLTDEKLNKLVYDKVEDDLLWIRINGSIVGGGVGLVIFLASNII